MGNGDIHPWTIGQEQVMHSIASSLRTIANCQEEMVRRAREKPPIDPDSLGMVALWREEVAKGAINVGFTDWMAWNSAPPEDKEGES